ncbi:MAG: DUF4396 domain-containing protein [Bacteroidales bacterium]
MKVMGVVWVLTALWSSILGLIAYLSFGRDKKRIVIPEEKDKSLDNRHSEASVIEDDMDMKGMDMKDMNMKGMDMKGMNMKDMDMKGMNMKDMNMKDMDMKGMDMKGMNMKDMDMKDMDMKGMDMKDMDMKGMDMKDMNMKGMDMNRPKWQSIALSAMHCGAGCTLADIIGEAYTGFHPIAIGGSFIIGAWVLDYILALIIGVYFQYVAIREMQNIKPGAAFLKAFKADFLSLTSWQIGMYGWMAIAIFVIFKGEPLSKSSTEFWFMMQIAMLCGFITAYPMNALLIKLGIKKGM